jgi:hypothetical protein
MKAGRPGRALAWRTDRAVGSRRHDSAVADAVAGAPPLRTRMRSCEGCVLGAPERSDKPRRRRARGLLHLGRGRATSTYARRSSTPEAVTPTWWPPCSVGSAAAAIGETTARSIREESDVSAALSLLVRSGHVVECRSALAPLTRASISPASCATPLVLLTSGRLALHESVCLVQPVRESTEHGPSHHSRKSLKGGRFGSGCRVARWPPEGATVGLSSRGSCVVFRTEAPVPLPMRSHLRDASLGTLC